MYSEILFTSRNHFAFLPVLSLRDTVLHIKPWVHSLQSLTEICWYHTGPAEQLHSLELLRRFKLFTDNQNFHCRITLIA